MYSILFYPNRHQTGIILLLSDSLLGHIKQRTRELKVLTDGYIAGNRKRYKSFA